ncbi:protein bric-a-brac 1-like isoform X2 [Belonocnema kinseyi]|uniref:protein bric-a-brac 1-like isoform X2 n=1 Tax=Belonocnema kinseyi TaxID=2817044 RepID=UPI00143DFE1F|nr:protein bric-a-brac 1-like isoform X2 [Belonocnema kinseyi]
MCELFYSLFCFLFSTSYAGNSCKHPIVILKDVNYRDLAAMLHFMYQGEVNIKQEDIASFLKVAEVLQIKGLTKNNDDDFCDKDAENSEHSILSDKNDTAQSAMDHNDCDVIQEIPQPVDKCDCSSSNKKSETLSQKSREDSVQKVELESEPEPEPEPDHAENNMQEYLDRECRNEGEQPLDCTLDFIKMPQPERDWIDYKPGIDTNSVSQTPETSEKQMEHQTDTRIHDLQPDPHMQYSQPESSLNYSNTEASFQNDYPSDSASCSNRGRRTVKGIPGSSLSLETTLRVISELGPTIRVERGKVIRMYSCPWCLRHFTRKENLKLHVKYIHGPLESLTCKLCGNKYKNSNSLRVHSYLYHNAKRNKHNKSPLISGGV